MQASDRIVGTIALETLDASQLAEMATRSVGGELFGLDKIMAPGTAIHARQVGDAYEKNACMSEISAFATANGTPRKHDEAIEQCMDEMMMNALYDAPVDDRGGAVFAGISVKRRITLRIAQHVVVQFACDGKQLAIAVRDAFGTLERATVLRYLDKCLHADQKVDRKVGGAGVGLYLMLNAATSVSFNVVPGVATEALCTFALDTPKLQLQRFGFFVEPSDPTGALVATPRPIAGAVIAVEAPRARAARHRRNAAMVGAMMLVAIGIAMWPRVFGPRKPAPVVELDSTPTSAAVEIDGKRVGDTPLTVTSLTPGSDVSIVFRQPGYRDASARLHVPDRGAALRFVQLLAISDDLVRVRFDSTPPGARIIQQGQQTLLSRTYTPADVFVEAGKLQRFTLTMRNHVPLAIKPFTPRPGTPLEKSGTLAPGLTLRVEATLEGKATVSGVSSCSELTLPFDCVLPPGHYTIDYKGLNNAPITHEIELADDHIDKFELGVVEAAPDKLLQPGGVRKTVFEIGTHVVTISDETGTHTATVRVSAGAPAIAR